ncbi:MAG: serine hydrolase, partial [Candidatus Falkowbacteria bacterium]|nr:serine hydrolase [Candidatus Falkowbacteria bacterium]
MDRVAFSKIASTSKGVINVRIEPIYIASSTSLRLGLSKKGAEINPIINSKAAIILAEEDNRIIYQKNSTTTLPIASLTKLIAIKTFFDTKPSLNTIVTYLNQDEKNNLKYVNKAWRSERLDLKEGDKLSLENLVYASLIGSYNNAVETIVRASGLKRDEFIELMNKNVISWGASHTHFIEPTGLAKENVSTAEDYAIITKELFLNPLIKKASTMGKYQFTL